MDLRDSDGGCGGHGDVDGDGDGDGHGDMFQYDAVHVTLEKQLQNN